MNFHAERQREQRLNHRSLPPHLVALSLLALFSVRLRSNLRFLRTAHRQASPVEQPPRVSVLVPARNEAATISSCVTSLLRQQYPDLEVIVLDDGSTDGTGQFLDALQAEYPQLTVLHTTKDPPSGWNGKSYACDRLAKQASGEWLLFTDADTLHMPTSIGKGVAQALALHTALLSAFPYQRTETWSERIIVSFIIDFIPLITLDFNGIWRGHAKRIAANGQYLLVHAATYRMIGGHASIHGALVDDFALAQRFRACGHTIALVDGTSMLRCRMYRTFHELRNGFSKNVLGALTSSPQGQHSLWLAPLFAWCYACLFVIPFFNLLFSGQHQKALAALEICWLAGLRGLVVWHFKRPLPEILTTPLAAWSLMALSLRVLYLRSRKQGILWKGRLY
ncbi:MAG TPA: glycosyltransferase family 2 protein [Ktedonobacterales bacterium]|nr:glycosyltransferase family 2 protein [Ktedonobacterales bacterium]